MFQYLNTPISAMERDLTGSLQNPNASEEILSALIPMVIERTGNTERSFDIMSRLLRDRIVMLGSDFNDSMAQVIVSQLLFLNAEDNGKDVKIFLNSPGGVVTSGLAIIDTMDFISNDVQVYCLGQACSMGAMLLCSGTKGKRYVAPRARVMFHQPSGGARGMASDIEIQAREILKLRAMLNQMVADNCGQTIEEVERIMDRDTFMSAQDAVDFGAADHLITPQEKPTPEQK